MTPTLFLAMGAAILGCPILLAGMPTLPMPGLPLTDLTAVMRSPMPRPEQPFASFEQTLPGPMMTALWPRADVPKKMTLVHGRIDSRCSSLGAKRQLRSEAFYPRSLSILLYKMCRIARSTTGAMARPNARFWADFNVSLTYQAATGFSLVCKSCVNYQRCSVFLALPLSAASGMLPTMCRHGRRKLLATGCSSAGARDARAGLGGDRNRLRFWTR